MEAVLYWTAAGIVWALSAWTIIGAIVEVARGKAGPVEADVIIAVVFHGATAVVALKLANLAVHSV